MSSYNNCTFVGNLGKDPELRYTPSGKAVCNFSIAINNKRGGKDETMWIRVSCWDKTAENASKYLAKGRSCLVSGPLEIRTYDKREGGEGTSVEVTAFHLVFLGGDGNRDHGGGSREGDRHGGPGPAPRGPKTGHRAPASTPDDDIPY